MLSLARPLVVLDVETTGPDPATARVVEVALVTLRPDGQRAPAWSRRVNPQCHIPPEASAVHGITDADVAAAPTFRELAPEVSALLAGADLAGYNLRTFDLPVLEREFSLSGVPWPCAGARIVDAFAVFKARESHTLASAVRHYCGREHVGAHGALADAHATLDVLLAQGHRYDLHDVDALAASERRPEWATACGRIRWQGERLVLAFGKHNGTPLAEADRGFLRWVSTRDFPEDVQALCRRVLLGQPLPTRAVTP